MKARGLFWILGIISPFSVIAGGIIYAITGDMSTLPLTLIWVGLLLFLIFFYVNFSSIRDFLYKRSTRYGANMAFMILIFVAIIAVAGMMSIRYKWRVDLTEYKRYTLSPQTIKILKSLKRDVDAIAFYRSDERRRQVMYDLLEEYSYHSPRFKFWFIDPDRRPAETAKYKITSYRTLLLKSGNKKEIVGYESEEKVTNALLKVIRDEVKIIYFVKGHGEHGIDNIQKDGYKAAVDEIRKENYRVKKLLLMAVDHIPDDAALVVISGPRKELLKSEIDKIRDYVDRGGSVLFMLDPGDMPNISGYLKDYGFRLSNDIIIDKLSKVFGANYLTPVVTEYSKKHPVTKEFNLATLFPVARTIRIREEPKKGRYNLAMSSQSSWAVREKTFLKGGEIKPDPEKDRKGPLSLAAVAAVEVKKGATKKKGSGGEGVKKWGKILVVGDSDFASNTHINLAGNKDFFLNTIGWLTEETDLISIRRKEPGLTPLTLTDAQGKFVFWLSVIIIPSLVAVVGVAVISRRRWGV